MRAAVTAPRGVVVMGKVPRAGRVKTRLCPPLTVAQAATLYRAFLADVFAFVDAERVDARRVFSCALGDGDTIEDARLLVPAGWDVVEQTSGGLGERIAHARAIAEAEHVVVLGSDAPTMAPGRIAEAFAALETHDAVCGPTEDGGYDLIGFAAEHRALLVDIPWSTPEVMAATEHAAARARLAIAKLALGYDVDRAEDLVRAHADAERLGRRHTAAAIAATLASRASDD